MAVIVKKLVLVCPECGETVHCGLEDVEFNVIDATAVISMECPSCGALLEEEELA